MLPYDKWTMEFNDRMPIYRQIILQFQRAFVRGEIDPGGRIPSIREISAALKINTNTAQRVYQEMEREGYIVAKRGTGYFFTEDMKMKKNIRRELARDSLERFVDEMRALGCTEADIKEELESFLKGVDIHAADFNGKRLDEAV